MPLGRVAQAFDPVDITTIVGSRPSRSSEEPALSGGVTSTLQRLPYQAAPEEQVNLPNSS
jgi:hypothetical protein